mmetsp:Transcript_39654/g.93142  ORF Transcript_39654/g.93142 Transcript_39654/m.93142 type:complete len:210 (+) Transcript_39654:778-1407(+)
MMTDRCTPSFRATALARSLMKCFRNHQNTNRCLSVQSFEMRSQVTSGRFLGHLLPPWLSSSPMTFIHSTASSWKASLMVLSGVSMRIFKSENLTGFSGAGTLRLRSFSSSSLTCKSNEVPGLLLVMSCVFDMSFFMLAVMGSFLLRNELIASLLGKKDSNLAERSIMVFEGFSSLTAANLGSFLGCGFSVTGRIGCFPVQKRGFVFNCP